MKTEAKSQTIRRMQSSLETWDRQLEEILHKKAQNGSYSAYHIIRSHCELCVCVPSPRVAVTQDVVTRSELGKRDQQLEEVTGRYDRECEKRQQTEQERDNLHTELVIITCQNFYIHPND